MSERRPAPRTLSLRELNRATLARQMLLRRRRLGVAEAIERLTPLQAQWPPAPYVGLWSRLSGFRREQLTVALERREVVKGTFMRQTLHLLSARDHPMYAAVVGSARRSTWSRYLEQQGVDLATLLPRLDRWMGARARTRPEVARWVIEQTRMTDPMGTWRVMAAVGGFLHLPAGAAWEGSREVGVVRARSFLPDARPMAEPAAHAAVIRRYLAAFGPASVADISSWGFIRTPLIRQALADLGDELIELRDERGRLLHDLRRAPRPAAETPAPVRFLPWWDQLLLAYQPSERERVLPERLRRAVIAKNGDVAPTVLVDGVVAARWQARQQKSAGTLSVAPFGRLAAATRASIIAEGERLIRFIYPAASDHQVRIVAATGVSASNLANRP